MPQAALQHSIPEFSANVRANYDPTHTTGLRNNFVREMKRRFRVIRGLIKLAIVDQDCFGMEPPTTPALRLHAHWSSLPGRRAFAFTRSSDKIQAFMNWLENEGKIFFERQGTAGIATIIHPQMGTAVEPIWANRYIHSAYQAGIERARNEMRRAGYRVPTIAATGGIAAAFNTPFHIDRIGLIYTRVYNDLKGITAAMDMHVSRVLAQGMADGRNPRELSRLLTATVSGPVGDLGITDTLGRFIPAEVRAMTLARTEVIRAHHVATIQEYRNWRAEAVTVKAEWKTAGDGEVCDECDGLEGEIFELDEIEGMIPYHPNCRCVALPIEVTDEEAAAGDEEAAAAAEEGG